MGHLWLSLFVKCACMLHVVQANDDSQRQRTSRLCGKLSCVVFLEQMLYVDVPCVACSRQGVATQVTPRRTDIDYHGLQLLRQQHVRHMAVARNLPQL